MKEQIKKDLELEFDMAAFNKLVENLDEKVLNYYAWESLPKCMARQRLHINQQSQCNNEAMNALALNWFKQKK